MSISDTPGKTPQEIEEFCERYGWQVPKSPDQILQLVRGFQYDDEIHALSIDIALHQLHALIRGEVIGEDEDETWYNKDLITPEQKLKEAPIRRRNHLRKQQREALDRLFGIEGGPDGDSA